MFRCCRSVSGSRVEARGDCQGVCNVVVSHMVKVVVAAGSDSVAIMVRCAVTGAVKHGGAVTNGAVVCCRRCVTMKVLLLHF